MPTVLKRNYVVKACPETLLRLANSPHLAPRYLNFLTDICCVDDDMSADVTHVPAQWRCYRVWVKYRSLIKTTEIVYHHLRADDASILLHHDGPLAQFKAVFALTDGSVDLICHYKRKIPLVTWLIGQGLDRILRQAVSAMDAYALANWQEIQASAGSKPQI